MHINRLILIALNPRQDETLCSEMQFRSMMMDYKASSLCLILRESEQVGAIAEIQRFGNPEDSQ